MVRRISWLSGSIWYWPRVVINTREPNRLGSAPLLRSAMSRAASLSALIMALCGSMPARRLAS